ncbi:hypothetical protein ACA910_016946 [Epithemia clementina (nom. ined.)]
MAHIISSTPTTRYHENGAFGRPTVSLDDEMNNDEEDDDSELSPEPSPLAPPQPQQRHVNMSSFSETSAAAKQEEASSLSNARRPTPRSMTSAPTPYSSKKSADFEEELSVPSLPTAPSPHSPPPPSLFSEVEEEGGAREYGSAARRPMSEVHLHYNKNNCKISSDSRRVSQTLHIDTNVSSEDDFSSSSADVATTVRHRSLSSRQSSAAPAPTRPSNLLPALLQLKQDLAISQHRLYILQQENTALNRQFEKERLKWQEEQVELKSLAEKERNELEQRLQTQHGVSLRELEDKVEDLETENVHNVDRLSFLQSELDLKQSALDKQQNEYQSLHEQLEDAHMSLDKQQEESRMLRSQLEDTTDRTDKEMANVKKSLQAEIDYWKEKLSKAQEEFRIQLSQTSESAALQKEQLEEHAAALEKAHCTIAELRAEKLALRQELVKSTIRRSSRSVANATCQTDAIIVAATESSEPVQPLVNQQEEEETFFAEPLSYHHDSEVSHVSTITEENDDDTGLDQPLLDKRMPSLGESPPIHFESRATEDGDVAVNQRFPFDNAENERIAVHNHNTDEEMRHFARKTRRCEEEEVVPVPTALSGTKWKPRSEQHDENADIDNYEARMQELVQRHHTELAEMKERLVREASQEAIRLVLAAVDERQTKIFSRHQETATEADFRENVRGESTGVGVVHPNNILNFTEHVAEETMRAVTAMNIQESAVEFHLRQTGKAADTSPRTANGDDEPTQDNQQSNTTKRGKDDLSRMQRKWQSETDELINCIQKECNEVFERTRAQRSRASPRTVAVADLSAFSDENSGTVNKAGTQDFVHCPSESAPNSRMSQHSKASSSFPPSLTSLSAGLDLDRTLDETEALLRSLMGSN